MWRLIVLTILTIIGLPAQSQDDWSLEMEWETHWGETGPGIYADSAGKLRLHKKEKRQSVYFCETYSLTAEELSDIDELIRAIPQDIPKFSNLYIADGCSDEPEVSLRIDIEEKWRLIHYTKLADCRWEEATPTWLSDLDNYLWSVFDRMKDCG